MKEKIIRGGLAGFLSIYYYFQGNFTPLIYILVMLSVMDYSTGILSAVLNKESGLSSKEAIIGLVKKLCCFFLVAVAFMFDFVIMETTHIVGLNLQWQAIFGIFSVCYLIATEGISILENLSELGITIPFLTEVLKRFRDKVSQKALSATKTEL